MSTKLDQVRNLLAQRKTDLQRAYKFRFQSTKLLLTRADIFIIGIDHPSFQFSNASEYSGYIDGVTKPSNMNVTFLDDELHSVQYMLEVWDNLKYDAGKHILYPKYVYEDQGFLTYGKTNAAGIFEGPADWEYGRSNISCTSLYLSCCHLSYTQS